MTRMIDLAHEAEWRDDGHRATSQRQTPAPAIALSQSAPSVPHADWSICTRFVREDLVVGHMVGTRPGVVCPKSWRSGWEPATLETVPSHPYRLPCRARLELALGAGDEVGAVSLTDAAIQATESLLVGLAVFDLAVVVGLAVAVGWATWVRAAMCTAWSSLRLPRGDNRKTLCPPEETSIGAAPLYASEVPWEVTP